MLCCQKIESIIGNLYAVVSDEGLMQLQFSRPKAFALAPPANKAQKKIFEDTKKQLQEYFQGERKKFDLPLVLEGSEFQKKVWSELSKIPFAKTISYKELAERIGNPKASRAVGGANGKNPICIIIPCHRVIAANKTIGGYSGGLPIKRKLLSIEGLHIFL